MTAHSILAKRRQGQVLRVQQDRRTRDLSALKKREKLKRVAGLSGVGNGLAAQALSRAKPVDGRYNLAAVLEGAEGNEEERDDEEDEEEKGGGAKVCVCVCVRALCVWCVCRTLDGRTSTLLPDV